MSALNESWWRHLQSHSCGPSHWSSLNLLWKRDIQHLLVCYYIVLHHSNAIEGFRTHQGRKFCTCTSFHVLKPLWMSADSVLRPSLQPKDHPWQTSKNMREDRESCNVNMKLCGHGGRNPWNILEKEHCWVSKTFFPIAKTTSSSSPGDTDGSARRPLAHFWQVNWWSVHYHSHWIKTVLPEHHCGICRLACGTDQVWTCPHKSSNHIHNSSGGSPEGSGACHKGSVEQDYSQMYSDLPTYLQVKELQNLSFTISLFFRVLIQVIVTSTGYHHHI